MMEIAQLLKVAKRLGASDIHLVVPNQPYIRTNGRLIPIPGSTNVTPEVTASFFQTLATEEQQRAFQDELEADFASEVPGVSRVRVNASRNQGSISLVLRLIRDTIPTFQELGLPEICKTLVQLPKGLILVTGPAGCGKSTTVAAMIGYLNERFEKRIITIEDPIEFLHVSKKCMISQKEVGIDTKSFEEALRRSLRQNPDVIMTGEIRDLPTLSVALTAAETGHLVLSKLHTRGAAETISRIINAFPNEQREQVRLQLIEVLEAVLSQILLPRADGKGLIAAFEVMVATPAIKNIIRENRLNQLPMFIEAGSQFGMRSLDRDLEKLLASGLITRKDAMVHSKRPSEASTSFGTPPLFI
jgi:twitching motility protein PilT